MYTIDKFIKHIEHLGFHTLIKLDKENESVIMLEDSILLVSKISKLRNYLESNFGYDLIWKTSSMRYNNEYCNFIVLTVLKKENKKSIA